MPKKKSNEIELDAVIAIYNSIRSQSLAAKEHRFKLYYWKVLTILVLIGFSIHTEDVFKSFDEIFKTGLIAVAIPLIAILFDLKIKSRDYAIKRDGELLKGLESLFANKLDIDINILPETFYDNQRGGDYSGGRNRIYEALTQYVVSILSIISSYIIFFQASQKHILVLLLLSAIVTIFYLYFIGKKLNKLRKLWKKVRDANKQKRKNEG